MSEIDKNLKKVITEHTQVEYMAMQQAELINSYLIIHIKKKPKWMSRRVYNFFLNRFVYLDYFKKI